MKNDSARTTTLVCLMAALSQTLATGCSGYGLGNPHVYNVASPSMPMEGRVFCSKLSSTATSAALARTREAWTGAAFSALFGAGTIAMTAIGPPVDVDVDGKPVAAGAGSKVFKGFNIGLIAGTALFTAATAYMFDRATAASTTAAIAARATSEHDDQIAAEKCNDALGAWNDSRVTALANARPSTSSTPTVPPRGSASAATPAPPPPGSASAAPPSNTAPGAAR